MDQHLILLLSNKILLITRTANSNNHNFENCRGTAGNHHYHIEFTCNENLRIFVENAVKTNQNLIKMLNKIMIDKK